MIPKVNIIYNEFLDEVFTNYFTSPDFKESKFFTKTNFGILGTKDELLEKRKNFKLVWESSAVHLFEALYEVTRLRFKRNTIDVFLVRAVSRSFPSPIILYYKFGEKRFVQTLLHELVHLLLNDALGKDTLLLNDILKDIYPNESSLTQIHILIYAILGLVYEKVFPGEGRMELEEKWIYESRNEGYIRAIEIIKEKDKQIIVKEVMDAFIKIKSPSN